MRNVRKVTLRSLLIASAIAMTVGVTGCATQRAVSHMNEAVATKAEQDFQASRTPKTASSTFKVDKGFYAAQKPLDVIPVNPHQALPAEFFRPANVGIQGKISLPELAANITSGSGVRVVLSSDVTGSNGSASAGTASSSAATGGPLPSGNPTATPPGLPPLPTTNGAASAASVTPFPDIAPSTGTASGLTLDGLVYKGNLSGLLDSVVSKFGLSWRWDGREVKIFRYETRIFSIAALSGDSTVTATLSTQAQSSSGGSGSSGGGGGSSGGSGGSNSGGVSGSSGQNTSFNTKMAIWDDVEAAIKANKSQGGSYSMNPSAGMVTVHDTPQALDEISAQMKEFNNVYSKLVILKVDIYSVEHTDGDDYGFDWSVFWKNAGKYGINLGSTGNTGSAGNAFGPSFTFTRTGGPFDGSSVVGAALSSLGKTSLVTSVQAVTLNGQTVPVNVSREQAYLQSYSTTLNGGVSGASTTTLTPGVVTEGFSMNFTPRVLDNDNVVMRYAVDLSSIEDIATFTSPDGESAIQLPTRSVRNFLQNAKIHSGESLMLTGLQQVQGKDTSSGPFSAKAWFLGGRRTSNSLNRTIVIIVTPYVIQQ